MQARRDGFRSPERLARSGAVRHAGRMNYRHAFHAGNFADLLKHAVLLELLHVMARRPAPLTVIDTHAGAGIYDLRGEAARRTGEGEAGIVRLMDEGELPPTLVRLKAEVATVNGGRSPVQLYPGSPLLMARALRPRDRLIACERRADDYAALKQALPRQAGAECLMSDGWRIAAERAPAAPAALLVLIDPPFEAADDQAQIGRLIRRLLRRNRGAVVAVWVPLKDLATYDALLTEIADAAGAAAVLAAEVRMRPPVDPMRMNGCAVVTINPPASLAQAAEGGRMARGAVGGKRRRRPGVATCRDLKPAGSPCFARALRFR
ncbi:MAG: 23S rRNA (adenine(2030)-N(6))-methyltransferase RlmJ [Caulobacterales bacterium]